VALIELVSPSTQGEVAFVGAPTVCDREIASTAVSVEELADLLEELLADLVAVQLQALDRLVHRQPLQDSLHPAIP